MCPGCVQDVSRMCFLQASVHDMNNVVSKYSFYKNLVRRFQRIFGRRENCSERMGGSWPLRGNDDPSETNGCRKIAGRGQPTLPDEPGLPFEVTVQTRTRSVANSSRALSLSHTGLIKAGTMTAMTTSWTTFLIVWREHDS